MEKTIELEKKEVGYTLRLRKQAKSLRLSIAAGGVFTVTAPKAMRQSRIEQFIQRKSEWVLEKLEYFRQFPHKVFIKNRKKHFAEHKAKTLALVQERLTHFNQSYKFTWKKLAVRNQKSRWGSCSRKRNLNFNYKIALLPPHLADYVIVHELCHLCEFNHSAKFWALVAKTLPNHRALRKELRKIGVSLN